MNTILLLAMLAAPGDVEVALRTPPIELTAPMKVSLGQCLTDVYPTASPSKVEKLQVGRAQITQARTIAVIPAFMHGGSYEETKTEAEYVDLDLVGQASQVISRAGGDVTFNQHLPALSAAPAAANLATFVALAFSGLAVTDIIDFTCKRDQEETEKIWCSAAYVDVVPNSEYLDLKIAGFVIRPLRRMP